MCSVVTVTHVRPYRKILPHSEEIYATAINHKLSGYMIDIKGFTLFMIILRLKEYLH